jgi:uncharacterized protein YwqG
MSNLSSELAGELSRAIAKHKLDAVAGQIFDHAAECYAMVIDDAEDYATVGNTRFGGDPDLPSSIPWPCDGDPDAPDSRFSNFIAQINFAEFASLSSCVTALPQSGILYLFVRYMECAAEPVVLDGVFFDGDKSLLGRTPTPDSSRLADEYLIDLEPQKVRGVPAVSIASYRNELRVDIDRLTEEIDDEDGNLRRIYLQSDLCPDGQIGQLLGFANPGDEQENLYRQLFLARIEKRQLVYNDYWDSMEEYEAYIDEWRDDKPMVEMYQGMRDGVTWLVENRDMIAKGVAEWRLLLRIDSNVEMNLNMMDADPLYAFIRDKNLAERDFSDLAGEVTQG